MPVLHVIGPAGRAPQQLLVGLAAEIASILGLGPDGVLAMAVDAAVVDGSGSSPWTAVLVQGRSRGAAAEARIDAAIRRAWPDGRLSVTFVRGDG